MRSTLTTAALALAAALPLVACVKEGAFRDDAFYSPTMSYTLPYRDAASRTFVSPEWALDNFAVDRAGRPSAPKSGPDWRRDYEFELDDGRRFTESVDLYDLRFVHVRTNARIWLRSVPVSALAAERDLQGVAADYAEGLSGTGFFAVDAGSIKVGAQQFATKIVKARAGTLGADPAYDVTIELANLDQLRLDPKARSALVRVVFARTKLVYQTRAFAGHKTRLPVRWMIGYVNSPADFERQQPEFEAFLALFAPRFVDPEAPAVAAPVPSASATASATTM